MTTLTTAPAATERQLSFLDDLLRERAWQDALNGFLFERAFDRATGSGKYLAKSEASALISALLDAPRTKAAPIPRALNPMPDVPAGHYAVPSLTGNNDLDFLRVDRPETGRWAGYTFVKAIIGGHPEYSVRGQRAKDLLNAVLQHGVETSARLYGREIGRCYHCNRELTDELSRELGIGPVCRER